LARAAESGYQPAPELQLSEPAELELAKFILRFNLAIETALQDYRLNAIPDYLFELAQKFTSFYDACPVLQSEEPYRSSRLALCKLTADVLRQGLNLLGIETVERM
jgi:arginyl-tRNA synthetase